VITKIILCANIILSLQYLIQIFSLLSLYHIVSLSYLLKYIQYYKKKKNRFITNFDLSHMYVIHASVSHK